MTDILGVVTLAKAGVVLCALLGASWSDLRTRRVPDRYWAVMLLSGASFLLLEMLEEGSLERPATLLSFSMPAMALVFIVWGYPEPREVLKGNRTDIAFTLVYSLLVAGAVSSFMFGDRTTFILVFVSFLFMLLYLAMYSFSIFGTRLIHGGADAKCMMALAAIYPWYGPSPLSFGPFYDRLTDIAALEYVSPFHLGVLINAALATVVIMIVYIPMRNVISGSFHPLRSWTTYRMKVKDLPGKHVWVVMTEGMGDNKKQDPTDHLLSELRKRGVNEVRVTPKVPFILSITLGFILQLTLGNIVMLIMLWLM